MKGRTPPAAARQQTLRRLFAPIVVFLVIAAQPAEEDSDFNTRVENPAYRDNGPRVCIDEAHRNHHTSGGRYAPLARLLRNDGYLPTPGHQPFDLEALGRCDVLLIANAKGLESDDRSAFTSDEIEAVRNWVAGGGSLLLIADHAPFGAAAADLSATFGIRMAGFHVKDETHSQPDLPGPFFLRFERAQGLLGEHPILRGRDDSESVSVVVTFGGQALEDLGGRATPLLSLSDDAMIVAKPGTAESREWSAAGLSHAFALELGGGRVVVVGEAGLFSAQVLRGETARNLGLEELRFGMANENSDDRQFVLNVLHWLSRLY